MHTVSDVLINVKVYELHKNVQETLAKGVELHRNGEFSLANQLYEAVINLQPDHADANHNLGLLKLDIGAGVEALPYLQVALQANTSNIQFWISYAKALVKLDRVVEAFRVLDLAKENGINDEELNGLYQQIMKRKNKRELQGRQRNIANAPEHADLEDLQNPPQAKIIRLVELFNHNQFSKQLKKRKTNTAISIGIYDLEYPRRGFQNAGLLRKP